MNPSPTSLAPGSVPDVLVLVADGIVFDGIDYGRRIEEQVAAAGLTSARHDLTTVSWDPLPPARSYVLTGGETSVHSPVPWMRAAIATARDLALNAEATGTPVIGICLGSQILAEALRPDSILSLPSIEIGLVPVTRPHDQARQIVPSFHYQAISPTISAVPGTRLEWRNAHTLVQAFSYGERVFGCQYHPELTADDMHVLVDTHADLITWYGGDPATAHRTIDANLPAYDPALFTQTVIDRIVPVAAGRSSAR